MKKWYGLQKKWLCRWTGGPPPGVPPPVPNAALSTPSCFGSDTCLFFFPSPRKSCPVPMVAKRHKLVSFSPALHRQMLSLLPKDSGYGYSKRQGQARSTKWNDCQHFLARKGSKTSLEEANADARRRLMWNESCPITSLYPNNLGLRSYHTQNNGNRAKSSAACNDEASSAEAH